MSFNSILLIGCGLISGHVVSQWLSYKNMTFFVCNRYCCRLVEQKFLQSKNYIYYKLGLVEEVKHPPIDLLQNVVANFLTVVNKWQTKQSESNLLLNKSNCKSTKSHLSLQATQSVQATELTETRKRKPLRKPTEILMDLP